MLYYLSTEKLRQKVRKITQGQPGLLKKAGREENREEAGAGVKFSAPGECYQKHLGTTSLVLLCSRTLKSSY